jgi:hypothetical protein
MTASGPPPLERAQDARRGAQLRRGVWRAVLGPVNLTVAGAAAAGAAALGSWALAALGGVAYGALVAWDLANPKFWQKTIGGAEAAPPIELPDPRKVEDPELRSRLVEILEARHALAGVLATTPADVRDHLDGTLAGVGELEARAAALIARGEGLSRYLATAPEQEIRAAVADLERRRDAAPDPDTRRQYEQALEARREHLRTLDEIGAAATRIEAHLARVAALLAALPARVVNLKALDAQAVDTASGDMKDELDQFSLEISSFEETLKTLTEVPAA